MGSQKSRPETIGVKLVRMPLWMLLRVEARDEDRRLTHTLIWVVQ